MPTNPIQPNTYPSVDRLALGIDAARGTEPAYIRIPPYCFEAEASSITFGGSCGCFDASASAVICGCFGTSCFEGE